MRIPATTRSKEVFLGSLERSRGPEYGGGGDECTTSRFKDSAKIRAKHERWVQDVREKGEEEGEKEEEEEEEEEKKEEEGEKEEEEQGIVRLGGESSPHPHL
ncbi:ryanodine receptor 1 [Palaemon carinicauda]|uniref:ryanodine receptor 1 n=1 Tax=Palaemon carinicauda TaxID=392227 RepID=UPI0035B5A0CA